MKYILKIFISIAICMFGKMAIAQDLTCSIVYSYDNAGNRITRQPYCESEEDDRKGNVFIPSDSSQNLTEAVFPNPTLGSFTVAFSNAISSGQVIIVDNIGRQVYNANISGQSVPLNISNLEPGMYFITVRTGGKSFQNAVVKN